MNSPLHATPLFQTRLTRAIVLAAGTGSRLRSGGNQTPKPLRPVAGVPLLVRVLRTLASEGVREAVVVTGYEGEAIRSRLLARESELGLAVSFVDNPRYLAKNGVSLLAAAEFVDRECLLSMADHLYSPALVRRLARARLSPGACALAVDRNIDDCFDLDDATKVRVRGGQIVEVGKELPTYDALDTGVFRIGPALIRELSRLDRDNGDCSLSEGVSALAARGDFVACDVGDARWIDVDTPETHAHAEDLIERYGDGLEPTDDSVIRRLPVSSPYAAPLAAAGGDAE